MSTIGTIGGSPFPRLTAPATPELLEASKRPWPARILVYAHDTASAGDALVNANALAVRSGADVDVLTVFVPRVPVPNVKNRHGSARCEERDRGAAAELIRGVRSEERQRLEGHVPWSVHLEVGDPTRVIVENAKSMRADLVVVGMGSRDPLIRQRAVSIPVSLARYTEVPILVAAPMLTVLPQTAVLFVDREAPDPAMIRASLRCLENAAVVWVLIHSGTDAHSGDGVKHDKNTLAGIVKLVRREAAAVSPKILVRGVYRAGDPVSATLSLASEVNADLIATAVHGAAGTIRSLVPNIADRLLLTAPCSVLVVPSAE